MVRYQTSLTRYTPTWCGYGWVGKWAGAIRQGETKGEDLLTKKTKRSERGTRSRRASHHWLMLSIAD